MTLSKMTLQLNKILQNETQHKEIQQNGSVITSRKAIKNATLGIATQ
jgi:hypothetical protein